MVFKSRREAKTTELEEVWQEIELLLQQLQIAQTQLRMFEPDLSSLSSKEEIESHVKRLEEFLNRVVERKNCLMRNLVPSIDCPAAFHEDIPADHDSFDGNPLNWLPDYGTHQNLQALSSSIIPAPAVRDKFSTLCIMPSLETSCNIVNLGNEEACCSSKTPTTSRNHHHPPAAGYPPSCDSTVLMQGGNVSSLLSQVSKQK